VSRAPTVAFVLPCIFFRGQRKSWHRKNLAFSIKSWDRGNNFGVLNSKNGALSKQFCEILINMGAESAWGANSCSESQEISGRPFMKSQASSPYSQQPVPSHRFHLNSDFCHFASTPLNFMWSPDTRYRIVRRQGVAPSIAPTWAGSNWWRGYNPVSETLCFKQQTGRWIMIKHVIVVLIYHRYKPIDLISISSDFTELTAWTIPLPSSPLFPEMQQEEVVWPTAATTWTRTGDFDSAWPTSRYCSLPDDNRSHCYQVSAQQTANSGSAGLRAGLVSATGESIWDLKHSDGGVRRSDLLGFWTLSIGRD
jgi:hypothetical protein